MRRSIRRRGRDGRFASFFARKSIFFAPLRMTLKSCAGFVEQHWSEMPVCAGGVRPNKGSFDFARDDKSREDAGTGRTPVAP
jgi:hypothetical protein